MKVLFVCLGNICRSPTAEGVFRAVVEREQACFITTIDSAGTADYHVGDPPDARTRAAARERGYDLSDLRARAVQPEDFHEFDFILAMDRANLATLQGMAPSGHRARLALLLDYAPQAGSVEVPDPYYGQRADFERVLDLVEQGAAGLLAHLREQASNVNGRAGDA